jgi:hypothetical protein
MIIYAFVVVVCRISKYFKCFCNGNDSSISGSVSCPYCNTECRRRGSVSHSRVTNATVSCPYCVSESDSRGIDTRRSVGDATVSCLYSYIGYDSSGFFLVMIAVFIKPVLIE